MKNKISLLLLVLMFMVTAGTYAAFPVKHLTTTESTIELAPSFSAPINTDTIIQRTSYRTQYRHRPYTNHESEAELSYIFGVLGLLVFPIFGIPALILGIIGADRRNKKYGRAVAGLVMGSIATVEIILIVALLLLLL